MDNQGSTVYGLMYQYKLQYGITLVSNSYIFAVEHMLSLTHNVGVILTANKGTKQLCVAKISKQTSNDSV